MKKSCKKNNVIKYAYKFMTESQEIEFEKHLKDCEKCSVLLNKIKYVRKTIDHRQKIKDKLPSVNRLQYPEKVDDSFILRNIFPFTLNRKLLRYAASLSFAVILIFSLALFLIKKDMVPDKQVVIKEKKTKETVKAVPEEKDQWCFNTGGPLRSQPVLNNNILYFGSDDKAVYSIDSRTGRSIWKFQTGGRISSPSIIKDDFIYTASADGFLYKLNSRSGELMWNKEVGTLVESRIFINHSEIYIANNRGEIMSLDLNGRELWKKDLNVKIYSAINVDERSIYFGTGKGMVYSLSRRDGNIMWNYNTGNPFISAKPLVLENQVILGDSSGLLYSFDKEKGSMNWQFETSYQIIADPIYFNNKIYLASDKLYCLGQDGKVVWKYRTLSFIDINFTICDDLITTVDNKNNIYSIHTKTGTCIKRYRSEDSILSFICAYNKIYTGNEEGRICVLK